MEGDGASAQRGSGLVSRGDLGDGGGAREGRRGCRRKSLGLLGGLRGPEKGSIMGSGGPGEEPVETPRGGSNGVPGRASWLCALRVCSVLHNHGKLLKWGEPEGEGEGSTAPPP